MRRRRRRRTRGGGEEEDNEEEESRLTWQAISGRPRLGRGGSGG